MLRELSQAIVLEDRPLTKREVLDLINNALASVGGADAADIERFLSKAKDEYGVIDGWRFELDDPLAPAQHYYTLAANQLTDILIARRCLGPVRDAIAAKDEPALPEVLSTRPDAVPLLVGLLADNGVFIVEQALWRDEIPEDDRIRWQLRALVDSSPETCARFRPWVAEVLVASMPRCRLALAELVVPVARWGEHPLGPKMVHETLLPLPAAQRDLFWSGPESLPVAGAGPWEGDGEPVWDRVSLRESDSASGLPLLLGWACASVVRSRRLWARHKLAMWGAKRLAEMASLLEHLAPANDPQILEDIMIAAAGAAMRCAYSDNVYPRQAPTPDQSMSTTRAL
jgi:hypothetical protein